VKILVSRCLLGEPCRYDGRSCPERAVQELGKEHTLIPVCPECDGGLPTPRPPAEITGGKVINAEGYDVTREYRKGAESALQKAREEKPDLVILKAKSPSCGVGKIYDGSFSRTLTEGNGVTADLLLKAGYRVITEKQLEEIE